ncbi:hypothetical protein ACLMJK_002070 [Lecanora helva]
MASNGVLPPEIETALVTWINSFPVSDRVHTLSETNDGQVFWQMLREINSDAFTGDLPSRKQSDYAREQNLLFIHNHISSYLDEQGAIYQPLTKEDIHRFASDGSSSFAHQAGAARIPRATTRANQARKYLKLILLILITPPNADIVNKIRTLPSQTQEVIATLIHEIDPSQSSSDPEDGQDYEDLESHQTNLPNNTAHVTAQRVARELELEAQQAELRAQLDRQNRQIRSLEAEKENLNDQYIRLQNSYEAVSDQSAKQEDQLKKLVSAHSDRDQVLIRELEAKISHQEEVISSKDFQITENQSQHEELQRRVRKLNNMADDFQRLEDELDISKKELLEQTKKANAGEKYRQKVQASQAIEKERDALRQQFEEARPKLRAYEEVRRDNIRLAKENREISSTLSQSEIGNSELRETKQGMMTEIERLRRDLRAMREFSQRQENAADSEDRSSVSEIHSSPTMVDGGLESELATTWKHEEQMQVACILLHWARGLMNDRKSRIAELEKQNQELTDDVKDKDFKAVMLQRQLDNARESSADQSAKELGLQQDISGLESSFSEVCQKGFNEEFVSPSPKLDVTYNFESTRAFKQMRDQLQEEQKRRSDLEEKLSTANEDVETATNERTSSFERHCILSELNIDLLEGNLVAKPELESIEGMKKQYLMKVSELQRENDDLRSRSNHLQERMNSLMGYPNQDRHEHDDAGTFDTEFETKSMANRQAYHELLGKLREATAGEPDNLQNSFEATIHPMIERDRKRLAKFQQMTDQRDALISSLEARLKPNEVKDDTSKQQSATTTLSPKTLLYQRQLTRADNIAIQQGSRSREETMYTQNLERELKLMASAYHDLAGRLQMSNVVLQRKSEAPRSWLGRQRKAMEGVSGLTR